MKPFVRCPTCRKEAPWEGNPWRPFCSERCATLDLGGWASQKFAVPAEEPPESFGDTDTPPVGTEDPHE